MRLTPWLIGLLAGASLAACDDGGGSAAQMQPADGGLTDLAGSDAAPDQGPIDMAPAELPDMAPAELPDMALADMLPPDMALPPPAPITAASGPFEVGYREIEVQYDAPVGASPRTLRTALWYPTWAEEGDLIRYGGLVERPDLRGNAPPIAIDGPVLVFSHGNGGFAEQSFFLTEYFASHGWLVAAPDHTGNTFSNMSVPTRFLFELRPRDLSAVIDALEALPADDPLAGRVDNGVLVAGHSFGGYTTLAISGAGFAIEALRAECRAAEDPDEEACDYLDEAAERYAAGFLDPRVTAGAPLTPAGALFFREHTADIDIPILMATAGRDQTLPNAAEGDPLWDTMDGPDAIRLDFPNAGHFSFASFCGVLGNFGADDGCGETFLDPDRVAQITREYVLAFGRAHLEGDTADAARLDGTDQPYSVDVDFSAKP